MKIVPVPILLVDDLLQLPATMPLLPDEAIALRKGLSRKRCDGLIMSSGLIGRPAYFSDDVPLVVLISDVDSDVDGGGLIIVGAHYLRQITRYKNIILGVCFSRLAKTTTPSQLAASNKIPGLHLAPINPSADQVFQIIRDQLRF